MTTKTCKTCGIEKQLEDFTKVKRNADGHSGSCKICDNKKKLATPEQLRERYLRWKEKNPTRAKEYYEAKKLDETYKQKQKENTIRYRKNNPGWMAAQCAKRRAKQLQATAGWDTELTEFLSEEAHHLRGLRDASTGIIWNVDHIVPLQGKEVRGLHVWNNLQVIPKRLNVQKLNRHCDEYRWSEFF